MFLTSSTTVYKHTFNFTDVSLFSRQKSLAKTSSATYHIRSVSYLYKMCLFTKISSTIETVLFLYLPRLNILL